MPATNTTTVKFQTAATITGIDLTMPTVEEGLKRDLVNMARSDVRRALKCGQIIIGRTQVGKLTVTFNDAKTVTVSYLRDNAVGDQVAAEIVTGTVSEVAPIIAGLYEIV